jgi:hypothetical protein
MEQLSEASPIGPASRVSATVSSSGGATSGSRFSVLHGRGNVDYALRTVQQSLVHFSSMADAKANSMLTICSIVVTVSITQWQHTLLRPPMMVLSAFGFVALVLAICVVKPSLGKRRASRGRVGPGGPVLNLLFFPHFAQLTADEFLDAFDERLQPDHGLYEMILRDIHGQGVALARRKYRLLAYSYITFLIGLGLAGALLAYQSF